MAGDWIPVRMDLHEDPAVIGISHAVKLDRFSVVGRLIQIWSWLSRQSEDGSIPFATREDVDRVAEREGFTDAMRKVGWINETPEGGITVPNFLNWLGQSAKKRLSSTIRKRASRSGHADVTNSCDSMCLSSLTLSVSSSGGKEGVETIGGKIRDGPAEDQSWDDWLVREWQMFFSGVSHSQRDPWELQRFFRSLIDQAIEPSKIRDEIRRKDRPKTQPTWEFERWLKGGFNGSRSGSSSAAKTNGRNKDEDRARQKYSSG